MTRQKQRAGYCGGSNGVRGVVRQVILFEQLSSTSPRPGEGSSLVLRRRLHPVADWNPMPLECELQFSYIRT